MVSIMTLKISHNAFSGMCSEFHNWRCEIARAAGYRTEENCDTARILLDWDTITDGNIMGIWPTPPVDALLVLLGTVTPRARSSRRMLSGSQNV